MSVILDFTFDFTSVYCVFNTHNVPGFCHLYIFLKGVCMKTSSLLVVAMSFERFCSLFYPVLYREKVNTCMLTKVSAICLFYGLLSASITLLTHGNENGVCFEVRVGINPAILMINFIESVAIRLLTPSILTLVFNVAIVLKLKQRSTNQRYVFLTQHLRVELCPS